MQSTVRMFVCLLLLSSVIASYQSNTKLRRDGVLNLYPFPRVGRALPDYDQPSVHPANNKKSEQVSSIDAPQRHLLRIGRSIFVLVGDPYVRHFMAHAAMMHDFQHHNEAVQMPVRRNDDPGMWFGPRIGRAFKPEEDESNDHSNPEDFESDHEQREKRQIQLM